VLLYVLACLLCCIDAFLQAAVAATGEDNVEVYHASFTPLEWQLSLSAGAEGRQDAACYVKVSSDL
jgi:hypothetical protein